jgi:hypothetical protein
LCLKWKNKSNKRPFLHLLSGHFQPCSILIHICLLHSNTLYWIYKYLKISMIEFFSMSAFVCSFCIEMCKKITAWALLFFCFFLFYFSCLIPPILFWQNDFRIACTISKGKCMHDVFLNRDNPHPLVLGTYCWSQDVWKTTGLLLVCPCLVSATYVVTAQLNLNSSWQ